MFRGGRAFRPAQPALHFPKMKSRKPKTDEPAAWRDAVVAREATLAQATRAARSCCACDLWERATQTVFGSGPLEARIMLVGEQPGDKEDRAGEPFVGPAGQLLDRALAAAGIARSAAYVTNVAKHFSWE